MKPYRIELTSKSQKQLKKLDPKIRRKIITAIKKLETNRFPPQYSNLTHHKIADFRLRVGDYRVLYDVNDPDQVVIILTLGHRREIYR